MDGGADALTDGDGGSPGYCNYSTWIEMSCLIPVLLSADEILTHGKYFCLQTRDSGVRELWRGQIQAVQSMEPRTGGEEVQNLHALANCDSTLEVLKK